MRVRRLVSAALLPLLAVLAFAGLQSPQFDAFLARELPPLARFFGFQVTLASLDLDFRGPSLEVRGLAVRSEDGEWIASVERAWVRFHPLLSLSGTWTFSAEAEGPRFHGSLRPEKKKEKPRLPNVSFEYLRVTRGAFAARLPDLGVTVHAPSVEAAWVRDAGNAQVAGGGVVWRGEEEAVAELSFLGSRRLGVLAVDRLRLRSRRLSLDARGRLGIGNLLDGRVTAEVRAVDLPAAWVRALGLTRYAPIRGAAAVRGSVAGTLDDPRFSGAFTLSPGRFGPLGFESAGGSVAVDRRALAFRGLSAVTESGSARGVTGKLAWGRRLMLDASGEATDFDLRPFMALFVRGHFPVGLKASGRFSAKGPLHPGLSLACRVEGEGRDLDVTTTVDGREETWFRLPSGRVSSTCVVGDKALAVGPTRIESESVDVDVTSGRVEYAQGLTFDTRVTVRDLNLVRQYVPEHVDTAGIAIGTFGGPYHRLTFDYDLELDSAVVFHRPLGRLSASATFDLTDLTIRAATLTGPLGRVQGSGRATLRRAGALEADVDWTEADFAQAAELGAHFAPALSGRVSGSGRARGKVVGTLDAPAFAGTVWAQEAKIAGFAVDRATFEGYASPRQWQAQRLTASVLGAEVEASGSGTPTAFRAVAGVRGLGVERLAALAGRELPLSGVVSGNVEAQGAYARPLVTARGRLAAGRAYGRALGDLELSAVLDGAELSASASGFRGAVTAWAAANLEGRRLSVGAIVSELPWERLPPGLLPSAFAAERVSGRLSAEGPLGGPGTWTGRGEGQVSGARIGGTRVGEVGFSADYSAAGVTASLSAWNGELLVAASSPAPATAPVEVRTIFRGLALSRWPELGAVAAGRLWGSGSAAVSLPMLREAGSAQWWQAVSRVSLAARAYDLEASGVASAPVLDVQIASPGGRPSLVAALPGVHLSALLDPRDLSWEAAVDLDRASPAAYLPPDRLPPGLRGTLTGRVAASGRGATLREARGAGRASGVAVAPLAPMDWTWSVRGDEASATLYAQGPRGIDVRTVWSRAAGLALSARFEDLPLEGWTADPGALPADLKGTATGEAYLEWSPGAPVRGRIRLGRLAADVPPARFENDGELSVSYREGLLVFDAFRLKGEGLNVVLSGSVAPGRRWDLKATGQADLALLGRFVPRVRSAAGSTRGELTVSGPWASPAIEGPVEVLAGAALTVEGFDQPVKDLDARGYFEAGRGLVVEWVDAQVGEGRLHVEGLVSGEGFKPKGLKLFIEARDLAYEAPKQVTYRADADLMATGTPERPELRGDVRLRQLLYARRLNWKSMVFEFLQRRPRRVEGKPPERGVYVDLAITGSDDLRVENNLADLNLVADLRAKGYLPQPNLIGRLEVVSGTVQFRAQEYEVLRSIVEFLGETQPIPFLDLHARTTVRQYAVNVDVSGRLDSYQVNTSSVPPLPPQDIIALLTLGTTSEEAPQTQTLTTAEAANLLTGRIQDELENQVSELLGFQEFHIDPTYSTVTQSSSPRLTVGRSITRALFARYSAALGGETEQDLEVQYTLNPVVQLLGTWSDKGPQSKGSMGGEIRFRFTFR